MDEVKDIRAKLTKEATETEKPKLSQSLLGFVILGFLLWGSWHVAAWTWDLVISGSNAAGQEVQVKTSSKAASPKAVKTIEFAPEDQEPEINSSFGGGNMPLWSVIRKSRSGYPIVVVTKTAPLCTNPWNVKEAKDAWKAGDTEWIRRISGCFMFEEGVRLEWIKYSTNFGNGWAREFRIIASDGSRLTMYGPGESPDGRLWFGWYEK